MPQFDPKCDVISKKKRSSTKFKGFFRPKTSDLKKKAFELHLLIFRCHFDGPYAGLPEANEAPLRPMGPGVIVPPAPPLSAALTMCCLLGFLPS